VGTRLLTISSRVGFAHLSAWGAQKNACGALTKKNTPVVLLGFFRNKGCSKTRVKKIWEIFPLPPKKIVTCLRHFVFQITAPLGSGLGACLCLRARASARVRPFLNPKQHTQKGKTDTMSYYVGLHTRPRYISGALRSWAFGCQEYRSSCRCRRHHSTFILPHLRLRYKLLKMI
jgi:hypothetical protein